MLKQIDEYLEFARETAYQAGQLTLEYFQKGLVPELKTDQSPVTLADKKSEEYIRAAIEKRYPSHAILGEEFGSTGGSADGGAGGSGPACRWIIDPIDGTQSFIHGVPLYAVLIGLEIEGKSEAGVAYFPALNEIIYAASGLGCWWNGRQAHVSEVQSLDRATVSFTDIGNFYKYDCAEPFQRLLRRAWYRAGWGDAYGYMLVASGRVEVMADPIMAVWDCAPFPAILREAGGYFGDWNGNEKIDTTRSVATSLVLLPQVLAELRS